MHDAGYGYKVYVEDDQARSDLVGGMGLGTIEQPDWNHHVVFYLVFQERGGQEVVIPDAVPPLVHPVVVPEYRRVTQTFGARPEFYKQYKVDNVPLRGHEGIDFGTPVGALAQAVDAGKVVEVADQGNVGYGRYIKIVHGWGESVYAHLEEQWLKVGDMVRQGDLIGRTGNTGNSSGPHLHFGLRVRPFKRADGWGGYTDPAPYLTNSGSAPTPTLGKSPDKSAIVQIIKQAAMEFGIDWRLLLSLTHGESSLNPLSRNPGSGAAGLGNLMPPTWEEWSHRVGALDIFDANDNARVTAAYLDWCIDQMGGNVRKGLWAYNFGIGYVQQGVEIPAETVVFASKVIHGYEVLQAANP
jgi:murein DD-endopeptidase MepM/ murein hydrolase activator NlpD